MSKDQVHFTMQGKGGVGKSLSTAIQAQYFKTKSVQLSCYDTDPVNDTFAQYSAFEVNRFKILGKDNNIDPRAFDGLMEKLLAGKGVAVVDNGASTFVPLMAYMVENDVVNMLQKANKKVYIHSVVTGGQAFQDTMLGLRKMLEVHPAPVVVWLNEFFGEIERDGTTFEDTELYLKFKDRIAGLVKIQRRNTDTFAKDMETMVKHKLTFDQALQSDLFGVMPKQRLLMIKKDLFDQLDAIEF